MTVTDGVSALALERRAALGRALDPHDAELARRWLELWATTEPELIAAFDEVLADSANSTVRPSRLIRSKRLAQTLKQAKAELENILADYGQAVERELPEQVAAALQVQQQMTAWQLPDQGVGYVWDSVNPETQAIIVQRATERIATAHLPLPAEVEELMKRELVRAIAVGDNPRTTGRRIIARAKGKFDGGRARATMIARTEMLDAHRQAQNTWEQANTRVLKGWVWVCALDARSCRSCVAMHGTEHPIEEPGPNDHHNGRCTRAPLTKSWKELGYEVTKETAQVMPTGEDYFNSLDKQSQDRVMGAEIAGWLRTGKLNWADLTTVKRTDGWRDAYHQTPLNQLREKVNAIENQ